MFSFRTPPRIFNLCSGFILLLIALIFRFHLIAFGLFTHPDGPCFSRCFHKRISDFSKYETSIWTAWSGDIFSMAFILLGVSIFAPHDEHLNRQVAKWTGRSWIAQLIFYWIHPFFTDSAFNHFTLVAFWVGFGSMWIWSEFCLTKSEEKVKEKKA